MVTRANVDVPKTCTECGAVTSVASAEAMLRDDGTLSVLVSTHPHQCTEPDRLVIPMFGSATMVR